MIWKKILLIYNKYLIAVNLVDNNWQLVKYLSKGTFLSNLDIIAKDEKEDNSYAQETNLNIFNYDGNYKTKIKLKYDT